MNWKTCAADLAYDTTHPSSRWRPLVAAVPRHEFMPRWWQRTNAGWQLYDGHENEAEWETAAYDDRSVIIRVGPHHADLANPRDRPNGAPTSSATLPSLVVRMLQHARIADGNQLLDVGHGFGLRHRPGRAAPGRGQRHLRRRR